MTSEGYPLARADLIRTLTSYSGITTQDGAADGTTLVDANLIGRNDFVTGKTILIMSGAARDEDLGAVLFDTLTGTITSEPVGFSAQIRAGVIFRLLNISSVETKISAIIALLSGGGAIFDLLNAILVLTETGGTVATAILNGTYDVYRNSAPAGVFRPVKVMIDFSKQTAAETVIVRTYYQIAPAPAVLIKKDEVTFAGVQDPGLINIELEPNRFGVLVTIVRIAGDEKDYDWEVFYGV